MNKKIKQLKKKPSGKLETYVLLRKFDGEFEESEVIKAASPEEVVMNFYDADFIYIINVNDMHIYENKPTLVEKK